MFNALTDPWIPVEYTDHTRTELGILDTLTHSDRIRSLADDAPTARAIERLLIAVVYHATAPAPSTLTASSKPQTPQQARAPAST